MARKRHRMDQIISKLCRADVELDKGKKVPEVCKLIGIAEQTYYRWRQKIGGMQPKMELKTLQKENARLKKRVDYTRSWCVDPTGRKPIGPPSDSHRGSP